MPLAPFVYLFRVPSSRIDRTAAELAIRQFLVALGQNPDDPELMATPRRVVEAYAEDLLSGVDVDTDALVASNAIAGGTALVTVRDIAVTTLCPHHLLPATGVAAVAFAPREKLMGVGAVGTLVDALARRLTLQESLGEEVVTTLMRHLEPRWVACRLSLSHTCMTARGGRKHGAVVETLAFRGDSSENGAAMVAVGLGR